MNATFRRRLVSFAIDAARSSAALPAPRSFTSFATYRSTTSARAVLPLLSRWPLRRPLSTIVRKPDTPEEPEVYRDGDPSIIATERAVAQLKRVAERESNPHLALRIAVEPGGCHGYQYKMELTEEVEEDDFAFEVDTGVKILVDSISLALVRGSTIDYVTELIGSQFAIKDNPQAKGAGCGCGVSWEPNL